MIKIDKSQFIFDFLHGRKSEDSFSIPNFSPDSVTEVYLNRNYYYSVNSGEIAHIQRNLLNYFLNQIELNVAATAFRKGFSYFNFLEPHCFSDRFLRLDISSFFHSVRYSDLERIFEPYFYEEFLDDKNKIRLVDAFLSLVTYSVPESSLNLFCKDRKILPIGFITSPTISNIIFRSIDIQIQEFCHLKNINYSRYADDMLFSSEDSSFVHSESFYKEISILVSQLGFGLNSKKTIKKNKSISLNGYVIQNLFPAGDHKLEDDASAYNMRGIWISKKKTKIIEKIIYLIKVQKIPHHEIMKKIYGFQVHTSTSFLTFKIPVKKELFERYASNQLFNKLSGYRSFLISAIKFNKKYQCVALAAEIKYLKLVEELNLIIDKW